MYKQQNYLCLVEHKHNYAEQYCCYLRGNINLTDEGSSQNKFAYTHIISSIYSLKVKLTSDAGRPFAETHSSLISLPSVVTKLAP